MVFKSSIWFASGALLARACFALECSPTTIDKPDILGASILDLQASEVLDYTAFSTNPGVNNGGEFTVSFCNVTVVHTHPGWNDKITTHVWLPVDWNGRFHGLGGGGYATGHDSIYLPYSVARGFAAASTDGGLPNGDSLIPVNLGWALSSRNNVNWYLLENYAYKATIEMAEIGKQITTSYYKKPPVYSYFSGCSGGGRQGLAMAQRFPDAFDGILSVAPAIDIETFIPAGWWPRQVMNQHQIPISTCEADGFVKEAIKACDKLDGVEDGIISLPSACKATASDFVGQKYSCNGTWHALTASGAKVVQAVWSGSGQNGYPGLNKDADITFYVPKACYSKAECMNVPSMLFESWIKHLIAKDSDYAIDGMTEAQFFDGLRYSKANYGGMLATNNPDLSSFEAKGGKMISWIGLADEAIPPDGIISYYQQVLSKDANAHYFYRLFEAPGVGHCSGGLGPIPNKALDQLIDWVEMGVAPDKLHAVNGTDNTARDLCPYPQHQVYIGGDPRKPESFTCAEEDSSCGF
jgi:hypothetical protein